MKENGLMDKSKDKVNTPLPTEMYMKDPGKEI